MILRFGDIVLVKDLLDPRGQNPKDRPAVVVPQPGGPEVPEEEDHGRAPQPRRAVVITPTGEIQAGQPIFVVAITTTVPNPLPDDCVRLPWQRPYHPRTGLNKENAAVCHWLVPVDGNQILRRIGRVSPKELAEIGLILSRLAGEEG